MSFQIDITSLSTWKIEVLEVPGTLQVIELYQTWCGPCKAIQSTFKRIYFDAGDRPLKFFTLDVEKVEGFEKYRGSCKPVFMFYKDGTLLEESDSVFSVPTRKSVAMGKGADRSTQQSYSWMLMRAANVPPEDMLMDLRLSVIRPLDPGASLP
eukprot:gene14209-20179_t